MFQPERILPQTDSYTVPTEGVFSQVGTWQVRAINNRSTPITIATFVVKDPASLQADLAVNKAGPAEAGPGDSISYTVVVRNYGPDDGLSVQLVDTIPAGTTFVNATQDSGLAFNCNTSATETTCTIATLPAGAEAQFTISYTVTAADGSTVINTAAISSSTPDPHQSDNTATTTTNIKSSPVTCNLTCPSDATAAATGCTAVVTYTNPTASGNCGSPPDNAVTCSPPSGSAFPIGTTSVICTT